MPANLRGDAAPARGHRERLAGLALVFLAFALTLLRIVGFVSDFAVNIPFEDQWDFLRPMFAGAGPWDCFFFQHGPHRQGLGGLLIWGAYHLTGWDIRSDAWMSVGLLFVAAISAVAVSARLRGRLSWIDAAFPLIIINPIHWDTMLSSANPAHSIAPLMLIFLLANAWICRREKVRIAAVALAGALLLFTGYGICGAFANFALAAVLVAVSLRHTQRNQLRTHACILILLGLAGVVFFSNYHWDRGTPGWRFPVPNWWDYPRFCALMFTDLLGMRSMSVPATTAGSVFLVLVLIVFFKAALDILSGTTLLRAKVIWLLTGSTLLYVALTAFGRLPVNIEAAFMWRYLTLLTPAACGLIITAESSLSVVAPRYTWVGGVAALALAVASWSNFRPEKDAANIAQAKRAWIHSYLETRDLKQANDRSGFWIYYPAPESPIIAERLRWLEAHHYSFFRQERR